MRYLCGYNPLLTGFMGINGVYDVRGLLKILQAQNVCGDQNRVYIRLTPLVFNLHLMMA